jgi:hypothetical protein
MGSPKTSASTVLSDLREVVNFRAHLSRQLLNYQRSDFNLYFTLLPLWPQSSIQ